MTYLWITPLMKVEEVNLFSSMSVRLLVHASEVKEKGVVSSQEL